MKISFLLYLLIASKVPRFIRFNNSFHYFDFVKIYLNNKKMPN
jgi:hypothetical protein